MGKIENFNLFLDKPNLTYIGGHSINGTLYVKVSEALKIKSLIIYIKGEANTHW